MFEFGSYRFERVYLHDWEWMPVPGEQARHPLSLVVHELVSRQTWKFCGDGLLGLRGRCPFDTGPCSLWVSTHGTGDLQCFLTLEWPLPTHVVDTFPEFRCETNGKFADRSRSAKAGQLDMARYYGVPAMSQKTKELGRQHGMAEPRSATEWERLVAYNIGDVRDLTALFVGMHEKGAIIPDRALLNGRYLKAAAMIEWTGIPFDVETHDRILRDQAAIARRVVMAVDPWGELFEGLSLSPTKFAAYVRRLSIPWPTTRTGRPALDAETFSDLAKLYPQYVRPIAEAQKTLVQLRRNRLREAVGSDGRSRAPLWPFSSITGRNQPPGGQAIFLQPKWARSLILAPSDTGIAYLDWGAQEIGIAAQLSGDVTLRCVYESSDPYIAFGQFAGLIPPGATRESHGALRSRCKALMLGVNYGMTEHGLAARLGVELNEACALLANHRRLFPRFWDWIEWEMSRARLTGQITTAYGWTYHLGPFEEARVLQNWPMQAQGAEMMRLAACFATEAGVQVCGIVHDAFLIQAPAGGIRYAIARMRDAMDSASRTVLPGLVLKTEVHEIEPGGRYVDADGQRMWGVITRALDEIDQDSADPDLEHDGAMVAFAGR